MTTRPSPRESAGRADDIEPDPVIEAYKQDIDRTLLVENVGKSVEERVVALMELQRLATGAPHLYWVAADGEAVVGYVYARLTEEPETRWRWAARYLMLDTMGVAEGYRGRGVGERLWGAVRRTAADLGAERVVLNVWHFNTAARRFYERLGFTPFHERLAVELRGERGGPG